MLRAPDSMAPEDVVSVLHDYLDGTLDAGGHYRAPLRGMSGLQGVRGTYRKVIKITGDGIDAP